ncbi:MAG: hypothetical protein CL521_01330 [Actinobacteria bacterium]|nr:hypothetical protein [Actinomycetota bacterium]
MTQKKADKNDDSVSVELSIDAETANGVYSNLAVSNVNTDEWVMDFIFLQPKSRKGSVRSRVIMSVKNAKRLSDMLSKQVSAYEEQHGAIDDDGAQPGLTLSFN